MEEKNKKRQIAKKVAFITSIFVILMSVTYAFITQTLTGTKEVVINAGVLDLVLEEENAITISDAYPMYDQVGMIQEEVFNFRLVNKTSNKTDYVLKLNDITTGDKLDTSVVKYGLTKENEKTIDLLSNLTNGVIDKGTINGNDTINYTLRLWIDSKVTDEARISGKSLSYKIEVDVSQPQPYQISYGGLYSATIDGVQGGFIFNEDGSAFLYHNYVMLNEFETGAFTFAGESIISNYMNFKVSEDGKELYFGEGSEQTTLNLIEKGGDILFEKTYSITIDEEIFDITFNKDGSLFMNTPDDIETTPAGTMYYKDGSIYDSETDELMGYTLDNGNMINFQGMLLKLQTLGTIKIHDDEYILDEYQEYATSLNTRAYNITDNIYTKEDLLDSYMVFQSESRGLVDAFYLSSDFIDSNTENGVIRPTSGAFYMGITFVQSGYVFSDTSLGTEITLGEGLHLVDVANVIASGFSPFNVIISRNIGNPILMEAVHTSETESYDMDLTDTESLLWFISDEYIDAEMIVGSTIVYDTADGTNLVRIKEEHITQISENVYSLATGTSDFYTRYFVKEDTYLDTDNDNIDDKYYKKGIYVDTNRPWSTKMKIVKYQP